MTTLEIVKELCKNKNISVKLLEEDLDFPNNTIYQWKNRTPGIDKLQKVADYFDVSVDYLLGRKSAVQTQTHDDKEFSTIQQPGNYSRPLQEEQSFLSSRGLTLIKLVSPRNIGFGSEASTQ